MSAQLGELVPLRTAWHVLLGDHGCCLRRAQSLEDEIRLLRQQAAARRLQPRPAPGNELLDYLRTLEPCAVAELTAGADSDILGVPLPRAQPEGCWCEVRAWRQTLVCIRVGFESKLGLRQRARRSGLQDICG